MAPQTVMASADAMDSMETLFSKVENMHGVVNLDAIGSLLQCMLTHMHRQEQSLSALTQQVKGTLMPSYALFQEHIEHLESKVESLNVRVDRALQAATARLVDTEYSAAELSTSNYFQLQKLSTAMSSLITRREVEAQYNDLLTIRHENVRLATNVSSVQSILGEVQLAQQQLHDTAAQQEMRLAMKLDRSELPHLQSLANKVLSYDAWQQKIALRLQNVESDLPGVHVQLESQNERLHSLQQVVQDEVLFNLHKMALKKDVHILAKELKAHKEILSTVAFQSNIDELRALVSSCQKNIDITQQDILTTKSDLSTLNQFANTRAAQTEVDQCVRMNEFHRRVSATNRELLGKTDIPFSEAVHAQVQELETQMALQNEKIAVAVKFVDWFTARGENYEHNINIIDRHLKNLLPSEDALKYSHLHFLEMKK